MRIVPGNNKEFFIITTENDVCAFVGSKPERANPLQSTEPRKVRITDGIIASCVEFASSLQRAASARR